MDGARFDRIARTLATRRGLLGGLGGLAVAAFGLRPSEAACPTGQYLGSGGRCLCRTTGRPPVNGSCPCRVGERDCGNGVCANCCTVADCPSPGPCLKSACVSGKCQATECGADEVCLGGTCCPTAHVCGETCLTEACGECHSCDPTQGACVPAPNDTPCGDVDGYACCGGACTLVLADPLHCGTCGNVCLTPGGVLCVSGECCQGLLGAGGTCSESLPCCGEANGSRQCQGGTCCHSANQPCFVGQVQVCCSGTCNPGTGLCL